MVLAWISASEGKSPEPPPPEPPPPPEDPPEPDLGKYLRPVESHDPFSAAATPVNNQTHDEEGTCGLGRPLTDGYKVSIDHRALEVEVVADLIDFIPIIAIERGREAEARLNSVVDLRECIGLARGRRDAGLFQPSVGGERLYRGCQVMPIRYGLSY